MTTFQMIPLDKLTASAANVRKTETKNGIPFLAASIDAQGLLNNLVVMPTDADDIFEVVAGGRRLVALQLLAKQGKIAADMGIPCNVLPPGASSTEISLAENEMRQAMNPADQFEAFALLVKQGMGEETIAARFGVTPTVVRQRMKLAAVSPKLITAFRKEEMSFEQLMAFTLTDDRKAQERVWNETPDWAKRNGSDRTIREALTKAQTASDSKLAKFVGLDVYRAAGGNVNPDLFDADGGGWLTDTDLLNRIVGEKLAEAAERVKAEGWKWVRHAPEFRWEDTNKDRHVTPTYVVPREQEAKAAGLQAEMDAIMAEHGEEPADEQAYGRPEELQGVIDALPEGEEIFTSEQKAIAGAYVSIRPDGELHIQRGVVRPEDKAALRLLEGAGEGRGADESDTPAKPKGSVPAALLTELTGHKTIAAQYELARQPAVALLAVTHALAARLLYPYAGSSHSRGHSVGCHLDNAKGERVRNIDHAAILFLPRLSGRRRSAVAAARSQRKSPEKPICSQVSGDVWARSTSGTGWP